MRQSIITSTIASVICRNIPIIVFPKLKTPDQPGFFVIKKAGLIVAHDTEYVQQADENVEDTQKDTIGCHDVIGFPAVDDAAGIKKYETGHDHDDSR